MLNTAIPCAIAAFCFFMSGKYYSQQKSMIDKDKAEAQDVAEQEEVDQADTQSILGMMAFKLDLPMSNGHLSSNSQYV